MKRDPLSVKRREGPDPCTFAKYLTDYFRIVFT
jgi:hypothetical protein